MTFTPAAEGAPPPRIELHVHIEGTVRPRALREAARRNGLPEPAAEVSGAGEEYRFGSLRQFIEVWNRVTACVRAPEDFRLALLDYAAEAASHGVVYLEASLAHEEHLTDWAGILAACCDAAAEAEERFGIAVGLTPDICRGHDIEVCEEAARTAVRFAGRGVVGFGVSGAEGRYPVAPHARAVAIAREGGLAFVPHAGEAAGPEAVREALDLGAVRLRHGARAVEDPALVEELAARGIVLDVALTSNVLLGVAPTLEEHPLARLVAAGVRCTVNTDDPALFGTDLSAEHAAAARLGLSERDSYAAGVAGALCDPATKARLAAAGERAFGSLAAL